MIAPGSRRRRLSSNSGYLDWKPDKIRVFQSFLYLCDVNMMLKMEPATFSIQNRDKRTSERMVNHPFFCYNDTKRIVYIMEELLDGMEYIEDVRQTRKVRHKLSEKGDFKYCCPGARCFFLVYILEMW